ncbi:probable ATP-dependent RNA helicase DDX46 [Hydractinia symbiolongicarpus]|uniref:probable ATP-dependent RNA helicase DDX46 n=1 Tax=Hydractinia symbiolongicarpus TaxID=13093 RepID=UPI0025513F38|nr:probable ATP-dependent RNA helicase DDX46 [Hydractinia symbiolongicarpus]
MGSENKGRKRDHSESPKLKKKQKRRYRNDRSKKWKQDSADSSSEEEMLSSDEYSSSGEKRKSRDTKRHKRRKETKHRQADNSSASSSSRSPVVEKRKKNKKKNKRSSSSSDSEHERKIKKDRKKHRRSESSSPEKKSRRSKSRSPSRRRKRSQSRSPSRRRKRSKERKRSRSPVKKKNARERSESPVKSRRKRKSHSSSPIRSKKTEKSEAVKDKADIGRSETPVKERRRRKSRSTSPAQNEKNEKSETPDDEKGTKNIVETEKLNEDAFRQETIKKIKEREKEEMEKEKQKLLAEEKKQKEIEEKKKLKELEEKLKKKQMEEKEKRRAKELQKEKERAKEKELAKEKSREEERERIKEKERDKLKRDEDRRRKESKRKEEKNETKKNLKREEAKSEKPALVKKEVLNPEEEMRKRKERIEAWRNARKKDSAKSESEKTDEEKDEAQKKWSLEDDDEDDDDAADAAASTTASENKTEESVTVNGKPMKKAEPAEEKNMSESEDEDLDPLDAFMKGIDKEINKNASGKSSKPSSVGRSKTKTITVVKTVVKKSVQAVAKPEVIEQNQDALEYSSEEDAPEDVKASDFLDVTKKKKELTIADHSKIYYASFRRNFYVEVPDIARMSDDEVKLYRDSLGDIQVRGKHVPKPIKTWAQCGLSTKVMNVLKRCGYEKPTPIQAQAVPAIMSGRDMIGIAKTGSGKTLAFLLPMLRHVIDQPELDEDDGPIAIIMTPTRELALQIYRESKKFCKPMNLTVACIYGGSGISEQISELKRGAEVIVCTPGRMIDMLAANNGKVTNCRRCTYLVLDEADRMFDMGFEPQVMRIIGNIRPDRQTVLFSATFPRQMEAVARKVLTKPVEIQVGGRSVVCSDVEQRALVLEADNKFFKLLELLGVYQEKGSVLAFVEKQDTADSLFKDLLKNGYPCLSLHGGMDQFDRDSTIADFKNGVTRLMVSTSVAARGLDVKNLILVVNYDCPNHYEDYVHRVGRTGRAGNKGTAFTFLTPEQGRNAGDVIKAFELSKCETPVDVQALWNEFKEEMAKEGKSVKLNSGFTGKGFKFNDEEAARVNESKKMRKFALGLQDSDDEAEAAENAMEKIDADLEKAFSNKPKVAIAPEVVEMQKVRAAEQNVDKGKLQQASNIAALINKKLTSGQVIDRNAAATAHILSGGALESLKGVGLAKQLADKVNAKLNYKPIEQEVQEVEKPAAVRYEDEIDINDFPQQARWRITSKEIIEQVRELSEAGVTVRGLYIPPNKKPDEAEGEKRLHLYIESLSERSIQIAKAEIKRLLKEELIRAESHTYRPAQTGRYKVV